MDVTIAVSTFGDPSWIELARVRALPSAEAAGADTVVHAHADTLHEARNDALAMVRTRWVVFLDADDELEPGYLQALAGGTADLRAPSVSYVHGDYARAPRVPRVSGHHHACEASCLEHGNWLVVGAMARTALVRHVGGWRDFSWSEDWDLWLRCWRAGASIEAIPAAVYRAHVRPDSRNRAPTHAAKLAAHQAIVEANAVPA